MEALIWTHPGIEEVAAKEIQAFGTGVRIQKPFVLFRVKNSQALARVCYFGRSIRGVMQILFSCQLDELEKKASATDFALTKNHSFAVRLRDFDEARELDTRSLESQIGSIIQKQSKAKVDLDNPDITYLVLVKAGCCFVGIDFAGIDLGKRDYKIFSSSSSLKGSLAFGMLSLAGFKPGNTLVDPCAKDGVIGIEAALFASGKSPHFFEKERLAFTKLPMETPTGPWFEDWDKGKTRAKKTRIVLMDSLFHNIQAIKKNSKIADVHDKIEISRVELDWLDLRFDKESIDVIASYPIQLTDHSDGKTVMKFYKELFHQALFVLKPKGRMILAMRSMRLLEDVPMKPKKIIPVHQGKELLNLVLFQKL